MSQSLLEGNEAIARGAVAAGCRFFAGYPITPATTILSTMLTLLPPLGGTCLQGNCLHRAVPRGFHGRAESDDGHVRSGYQPVQRADFFCCGK